MDPVSPEPPKIVKRDALAISIQFDVAAWLRTGLQTVPMLGGPLAQAWSEYQGSVINQRLENWIFDLATNLEKLQERYTRKSVNLTHRISLLEHVIEKVVRLQSGARRKKLAVITAEGLTSEHVINDYMEAIDQVDSINDDDMVVLEHFFGKPNQPISFPEIVGHFTDKMDDGKQGLAVASLSKLISRGIVIEIPRQESISYRGKIKDHDTWMQVWGKKSFILLTLGMSIRKCLGYE